MSETITETVTNYFRVHHATIKWEDKPDENIEYVQERDHGQTIRLYDYDEDGWSVGLGYSDDQPYLRHYDMPIENMRIISTDSIEEIEVNWVETLVAVAELDIEETTSRPFIRKKTERELLTDDPDVTIWMKSEWEAHNADD